MKKSPKARNLQHFAARKAKVDLGERTWVPRDFCIAEKSRNPREKGFGRKGGGVAAELRPLMSGAIRQKSWKGRYNWLWEKKLNTNFSPSRSLASSTGQQRNRHFPEWTLFPPTKCLSSIFWREKISRLLKSLTWLKFELQIESFVFFLFTHCSRTSRKSNKTAKVNEAAPSLRNNFWRGESERERKEGRERESRFMNRALELKFRKTKKVIPPEFRLASEKINSSRK